MTIAVDSDSMSQIKQNKLTLAGFILKMLPLAIQFVVWLLNMLALLGPNNLLGIQGILRDLF